MAGEAYDSGHVVNDADRGDHPDEGGSRTNMSARVPPTQTAASKELPERRGGDGFSRRELLRRAGVFGAAAAVPRETLTPAAAAPPPPGPAQGRTAGAPPRAV